MNATYVNLWRDTAELSKLNSDFVAKNIPRDQCCLWEKKRSDAHIPGLFCFYFCTFVFLMCGFGLLFQRDLVNTIGESAALGAAGVVLWGSMQYASSEVCCASLSVLRNHLNTSSLTPYPP